MKERKGDDGPDVELIRRLLLSEGYPEDLEVPDTIVAGPFGASYDVWSPIDSQGDAVQPNEPAVQQGEMGLWYPVFRVEIDVFYLDANNQPQWADAYPTMGGWLAENWDPEWPEHACAVTSSFEPGDTAGEWLFRSNKFRIEAPQYGMDMQLKVDTHVKDAARAVYPQASTFCVRVIVSRATEAADDSAGLV